MGVLLLAVVVTLAGGILYLTSKDGNEWLRGGAEEQVSTLLPAGEIAIDDLQTDLISRLQLSGVTLLDHEGLPLVELDRVRLHYSLAGLIVQKVVVRQT